MPDDLDINAFFEGCVGVIADKKIDIEHVVIKAYDYARKYLATLPIHPSQKEIARDDESTTFSYDVRPNYEFLQALLMQVDQIEVVEPESVRKQMRNIAKNLMHIYK